MPRTRIAFGHPAQDARLALGAVGCLEALELPDAMNDPCPFAQDFEQPVIQRVDFAP